jgi:protein-tyrosine phosphatase
MIGSVLVVCTGNICRSPAGERALARLCPGLPVTSAGLGALVGNPADPVTTEAAMRHFALDLSGHVARQFSTELGLAHDLILVMEPHHRADIQRGWPQLSGRVMLFDHWTGAKGVEDPYRRPPEVHARALTDILRAAEAWAPRLTQKGATA